MACHLILEGTTALWTRTAPISVFVRRVILVPLLEVLAEIALIIVLINGTHRSPMW